VEARRGRAAAWLLRRPGGRHGARTEYHCERPTCRGPEGGSAESADDARSGSPVTSRAVSSIHVKQRPDEVAEHDSSRHRRLENATRRALHTATRLPPPPETACWMDASTTLGASTGSRLGTSVEREMMARAIDGKGSW